MHLYRYTRVRAVCSAVSRGGRWSGSIAAIDPKREPTSLPIKTESSERVPVFHPRDPTRQPRDKCTR